MFSSLASLSVLFEREREKKRKRVSGMLRSQTFLMIQETKLGDQKLLKHFIHS